MLIEVIHQLLINGLTHSQIKEQIADVNPTHIKEAEDYQKEEFEKNRKILEDMLTDQSGNSVLIWNANEIRATHMIQKYKRFDPDYVKSLFSQIETR